MVSRLKAWTRGAAAAENLRRLLLVLLGAAITSFGLHNIHQRVSITEGGVLGLLLLLNHWFGLPTSLLSPVLDLGCYALAFRFLGASFIRWSAVATVALSGFFRVWELFPPMLPDLSPHPLAAAVLGALFIGVGVGLVVRQGGSCGGDDALALTIAHVTGWRISRAYLISDLTVLTLSLSYIPLRRIVYSLVTVTLSSWIIDLIQGGKKKDKTA